MFRIEGAQIVKSRNGKYVIRPVIRKKGSNNEDEGWASIIAKNIDDAQRKFLKRFGVSRGYKHGALNYSFDYTEVDFENSDMYKTGNFGEFCHEVIC